MGSNNLPVVDPLAVQDILVTGALPIEDMGYGLVRVTCFTAQTNPMDGSQEHVVQVRVVLPRVVLHMIRSIDATEATKGARADLH